MNTVQNQHHVPPMKASDADRDQVVTALSEHFQAGRLTSEELDERTGLALTARTLDQLRTLTADLPSPGPRQQRIVAEEVPGDQPFPVQFSNRLPMAAGLAILLVIVAGLSAAHGRHGWDIWWIIPVAFIAARRLTCWRRPDRGQQRF